ncbi:hypothetical protein IPC995_22985 [Pseudomonas aeruginosa]|nr:hypothetical protein IPC995_22985 [Pseudomonas aeruginosa]
MSWRSESPFTVGFRAYVGFWFHCSPNPNCNKTHRWQGTHRGKKKGPAPMGKPAPDTARRRRCISRAGRRFPWCRRRRCRLPSCR